MKSPQLLTLMLAWAICAVFQSALCADITQDRINQVLDAYIANPQSNPNGASDETKVWGRSSWSLAALTRNRSQAEIDLSNTYLQSIPGLAPIPIGDPDSFVFGGFFQMPLITRLYMKFKDSPLLTQATKDALEGYLWDYLSIRHVNVDLMPTRRSSWYQFNSENKDTVEKHALLLACEGLLESPNYGPNTILSNGKKLSEYRDFLQAYYVEYFRQRAREGMTYEVGSPAYLRLTLSSYYNLHDFSRSSALRKVAGDYLTLYWALKVQEYLPSSRMWGGAVIRHEKSYVESASSESYSPMPYVYGWNDVFSRSHPELLNMMTSSYRPPAIVSAIASDANRPQTANQLLGTTGSGYLLTSRIWGRGTSGGTNFKHAIFESDNSGNTRRDTWIHPNYNIGGFTFDQSEGQADYIDGNRQNRSMGIYFNSDRSARIIFHGEGSAADNASFMDINGVVGKDVLVGARSLKVHNSGDDTFIYISNILRSNLVNDSGWIFTRTADTYVGIYIANGTYNDVQSQLGNTMVELTDEWSPVVFQLGAADEYGNDFEAFKTSLKANTVSISGGKLTYTSEAGEIFEMWANSTNIPKVNGVAVDLNPAKTYESPFLNAYHGLNTMTISYPGYPDLRLDFANHDFPQWDDYQTVALWNMDALNGTGEIADDNGGNVARDASDQRPARPLTLNGATLTASGEAPFGKALSFDGVNDWARASGAWSSAFRTVKIEGWIYPDDNAGANVIVAADGVWKVELNNNNLNFVTWNDSVIPTTLKWPVPLTTNTWHHFVASLDNAGTMQLSANGDPPVVAVVTNLRSLNKDIDLGDRPGSNRYFDGWMDDIKISHLNTKAILPRDPMSSLGAFRHAYGLAADGSDDLLDDSGNGVANILYFLFGLGDPSSPGVPMLTSDGGTLPGLPTCEISGGEFIYSYVHRLNHTGSAIRVDSSADLAGWGDIEDALTAHRPSRITTTPGDADYEIRHLHFDLLPPKMFLRFRVAPGN